MYVHIPPYSIQIHTSLADPNFPPQEGVLTDGKAARDTQEENHHALYTDLYIVPRSRHRCIYTTTLYI